MENELARHLLNLSEAFSSVSGLRPSTVGRLSASDGRFFKRIEEGQTFTVKKYDTVMAWFSDNWPDGPQWPCGIPRPQKTFVGTEAAE
ncbi:hypothetical protein [Nitratireductor indicus]|uniref:hypothetical protein n=1 Tax=Nitratireductor indicus TaxID=721133 RepID=UPI002874D4A2|nr:hypothetical protein [Nitratireductor indicus]MDS1135597.1 hypothetical protein [Nitratireductor indicus]